MDASMLRRLRQFFTLLSLALLIGLVTLWARGDVLIVRHFNWNDVRSHLFVRHGAIELDFTGMYYLARDYRRAQDITLAVDQQENLSPDLLAAAEGKGP